MYVKYRLPLEVWVTSNQYAMSYRAKHIIVGVDHLFQGGFGGLVQDLYGVVCLTPFSSGTYCLWTTWWVVFESFS